MNLTQNMTQLDQDGLLSLLKGLWSKKIEFLNLLIKTSLSKAAELKKEIFGLDLYSKLTEQEQTIMDSVNRIDSDIATLTQIIRTEYEPIKFDKEADQFNQTILHRLLELQTINNQSKIIGEGKLNFIQSELGHIRKNKFVKKTYQATSPNNTNKHFNWM